MSYIALGIKLAGLLLSGRVVREEDIEKSYTAVSGSYERMYLSVMHRYNDILLKKENPSATEHMRILDLAGGTGYNCRVLKKIYPRARYDLVDASAGMLKKAGAGVHRYKKDMLAYLRQCDTKYDIIVCSWAIIYSAPKKVVKECCRHLKPGGLLKVIVNKRDTLPQIRRLFPRLLSEHVRDIKKVMLKLPTPRSLRAFDAWFGEGFTCLLKAQGRHKFCFASSEEAIRFVTSTGALAGYDRMLDLRSGHMRKRMAQLLEEPVITHSFAYGIYQKKYKEDYADE